MYAWVCIWLCGLMPAIAQDIPSPKEHFGFNIGDDYKLANYTQAEAYYKKVAEASDRVKLEVIGQTEEGRNQYVMIVSSPENIKKLGEYKDIAQRLARAEDITEAEAQRISELGKAVVWIDGGLHATETVGSHQLIETYYQLVSRNDPETLNILDNVIILLSQVNPDGQELVANWYMRESDPAKRNTRVPRLYQKYIGHDNNRDFYMMNMKETTNISKQQYVEWMPQIVYNHHQTAPAGAVVAGPPYRDPFNFVYDPLLITGIDGVAAAMINRLNLEGKPGYTRLGGSVYSTWWNGGLRTTPYFHNMVGLLTEMIGNPTPANVPFVPERMIPNNDTPYPVQPGPWKFRNSIDYSVSLNYAVLDYASRNRSHLLYNIYKMGKNSIDRGSRDNWTLEPKHLEGVRAKFEEETGKKSRNVPMEYYDDVFKNPDLRDARAYILSADQADFPTAVKFINALIKSGIAIERATAEFTVNNKTYPAGSYIVKTAQAFRPHVMDMFEPQDHPNDFLYPGGPPVRPYDAAGWTLAFQMGVEFDRVLEGLEGPFERIPYGAIQTFPEKTVSKSRHGYLINAQVNNAFIAVNDLLKAGVKVYRITEAENNFPVGSFYIPAAGEQSLKASGAAWGVEAVPASAKPKALMELKPSRIALVDVYGGSMTAGWTRWLMEQFHFPFERIFPQRIDAGDLNADYDLIIFMNRVIPETGRRGRTSMPKASSIPEAYRATLGNITEEKSIPQLKSFLENGGRIITVGTSTSLAYDLDLPVKNALVKTNAKGKKVRLTNTDYYIPGSILAAEVDVQQMANWGMEEQIDYMYNNSPVFTLDPDAASKGVVSLASFQEGNLLRSGWAWGADYLHHTVAAFKAKVGKGEFYAYGPEVNFRAQSHGTFKQLFNLMYVDNQK